ncbi:hypothetical protein CKM354_001031500 [Cercospora kikuchii]|nr:uncharacterized protein CKM354_001031500 [Cercospora kikuchii]GIZ47217.1 hypothetical protein CKM354_001031500 [Cercospora kikuchii]
MAKGQQQFDQLPEDVHFVTMQAGGNDALFYGMARDCIFHNEHGRAYGGYYLDPTGECAKSIGNVRQLLDAAPEEQGIWKYMDDTIKDIFRDPRTSKNDFKLYVLGYAHLFNIDAPDSDWCNDKTFSVSASDFANGRRPPLSSGLRTAINDLTTRFNDRTPDVIKNMRSNKVQYVSTTERFNGHRFCEKDHNMYDQYFGSNVWLWNVSPDGLFPSSVKDQAEANKDWADVYNATGFVFMPNMEAWDWTDMLNMEKGPEAKSPQQGWSPGVVLRPLHPKLARVLSEIEREH